MIHKMKLFNRFTGNKIILGDAGELGRGLFATKPIKSGEIVEESPIIRLSPGDMHFIENTILGCYVFDSPTEFSNDGFLALGLGSLFNHSDEPNVEWEVDPRNNLITFKATENIKSGKQLFINYGWDI